MHRFIRLIVAFFKAGILEVKGLRQFLLSPNHACSNWFPRWGAPDYLKNGSFSDHTHQALMASVRRRSGMRQPKPNLGLVLPIKDRISKPLFYRLLQRRASGSFGRVAEGWRGMACRLGDLIGDHYVVEKLLYVGAMSELYLVRDRRSERLMVAKVAHTRQYKADEVLAAFEREISFMNEFEHPNLLRCKESGEVVVYDHNNEDEPQPMPYLIMPYVQGRDLKRVLSLQQRRENKPKGLPLADVLAIFDKLLPALECLHDEGLVHCNIKPDNILLGDDGHLFLIDLGNATPIGQHAAFGNQTYSAPETGSIRVVNETSDIYSLGKLFFELVTGQTPAEREPDLRSQRSAVATARAESKAFGWHKLLPGRNEVSYVAHIISKATSAASIDRYPDVEALRDALNDLYTRYMSQITASSTFAF